MDDLGWYVEKEIPHLRRFAKSLCRSAEEGDDLVQDTLERAWSKRHQWRRDGSVRSWLFRILYRLFLNSRRGTKRSPEEIDDETLADPKHAHTTPQEAQLMANEMSRALAALPHEQRAAVVLIALEGASYDEAASMLDIPIGTLRSRLFRGREALRETIDRDAIDREETDTVRPMPARLRRVK
ncbi:RNA polymerase, sigma-24 subunit, ECF subfamily [Parvibaculum lavamentivorans DS-1]|uniref:RNA polymerase, sigma-24 subunit, ECF subfamily n=1 Tax=Parvibaculum lavamentivorans (strain DS-1 / DSM 13023 / NCIMB 13966) TaxID=402881 RepID=A7HXY6_PARL1|nr:RNA polymerase sigma factor [Parvibaculum lavamentivorans]ABS64769.1 RNA polymerase, sigma-24 subunit, ECF subfamily [Parvibaculum lavamentivorans DS-1]